MKHTTTLILILFTSLGLFAQDMKKVKISDGKIKMQIPETFTEMTPEDMVLRLPSVRNPLAAYTSEDRITDLSVKVSATQWKYSDAEIAREFFKSSIMNLFDRVKMIDEGYMEVHKNRFIYFEFESYLTPGENSSPERKYNYVLYYIGLSRTLVISFRCPEAEKERYEEMVPKMVNSIKIRGI